MKTISVWQPFAALLVSGFKIFETRTWPAPKSLIGQRIGIASTKVINPAQKAHFSSDDFRAFYERTMLPDDLKQMPNGYMLGTAVLEGCELMTEELLDDVSDEEKAYGLWDLGNWGWRMVDPVALEHPFPVRGQQGIWEWRGELPETIPVNLGAAARYKEVTATK